MQWKYPRVAVIGGHSSMDVMERLDRLVEELDTFAVCGEIANTFLAARGGRVGRSVVDADSLSVAAAILAKAEQRHVRVLLPIDALTANRIAPDVKPSLEGAMALFDDKIIGDIGPRTTELLANTILTAAVVYYRGPAGYADLEVFAAGTRKLQQALAASPAEIIEIDE